MRHVGGNEVDPNVGTAAVRYSIENQGGYFVGRPRFAIAACA
jgi:hypothetical protein